MEKFANVDEVDKLARGGLDWLLASARTTESGLAWPVAAGDADVDWTLYQGTAGIVLTLLEGQRHFGADGYGEAAVRGAHAVTSAMADCEGSSLYVGVAGVAVMARVVADQLGDEVSAAAVGRALDLARSRFDGDRWGDFHELLLGNAGIGLAALACGDVEFAVAAVEPYLRTARPTETGATWEMRVGAASTYHHFSHGTLGIVHALAAIGHAAGRTDLIDLALAGAADVVSRDEAGPDGFLVPHSDPQAFPDRVDRYSYGWCHGPTGDAQAFRMLGTATKDPKWTELAGRCWRTVRHSGLPQRTRPGFWDNNGACCGTAGVLALACDRHVEHGSGLDFADVLVADLVSRATVDAEGVRWSNVEHRATPSTLEPRTGWAMGNAGIVRELLRYVRIRQRRDPGYAVTWPDRLPADR